VANHGRKIREVRGLSPRRRPRHGSVVWNLGKTHEHFDLVKILKSHKTWGGEDNRWSPIHQVTSLGYLFVQEMHCGVGPRVGKLANRDLSSAEHQNHI
jgi:hypothetical protein